VDMCEIGVFWLYTECMKIEIEKGKESSIFYDSRFYDTGVPISASFSEAFRLTRVCKINAQWDHVPYDPALWKDEKLFNFMGDIDMTSGFGGVSFNLMKQAIKAGCAVPLAGRFLDVRDQVLFAARNLPLMQSAAMVWHDQPRDSWHNSPFKKNIAIVPFETTLIPHSWIGRLNSFDALLVPCKQNIEAFRASGVHIPIELIHWGVDPNVFYPLNRPESPTMTFGTMGALTVRKGTDVLVEAFLEAFPTEQDVKLICKTSFNNYPFMVKDKRIEVQQSPVSHKELMD